jgi:hypothetical protein
VPSEKNCKSIKAINWQEVDEYPSSPDKLLDKTRACQNAFLSF